MYDQKQNNKNYIINNSHYPTENENIYSNKFIREKYLVLNEVNPKNTILFKVNYKPDIIINHQTLNNIRTNISIRPIPSLSNNINNNNQQNNFFQNKYYKKDDAKNKNNKTHLFEETPIWKSDFIQGKIAKLTEAFLLDENNDIEQNMNYFNSIKDSKKEKKIFKNRINNHSRNNNDLRNNNNKVNNIIHNSQKYIKNKENNEVNNNYGNNPNNNLYMINNDKSISKYDYNYNIIKPSGYYNNKNLTTNLINYNNNNNKNSKIFNIINNNKYQIKNFFFPNKKINNILRIINKNDYNNNSLNVNLNYYQIRLFKKFFKHFKQFYKICLKKYFSRFSEKINSIIKKNKYDIDNNNNNQSGRNIIEPKNDINKDLIDNLLIKKRNKTQIKRNIRDIIKNYRKPFSKKINNPNNLSFKASSVKTLTRDNLNPPITPITPILQFGNQKIVIRDISFKTEGNNIENKLYRDSEELIKKYKQIQTRKGKFNNFFGINKFKNDNDSLINQIRESMKLIKKNRKENSVQDNSNISSNTLNSITNKIEETRFIPRKRKLNPKINDINELKINNINNFNNINNEKNIENKEKEQNELLRNNNNMDLKFKNKKKNSVLNKSFDNNNNKNKINYKSKSDINYPPKNSKRNHNKHKIAKKYAFSVLIKNISSKDGRINIYIKYYFLFRDKTPLISSYNILEPSNNFSINYIKNDN